MEVKSKHELTIKLASAIVLLTDVMATMTQENILIADIPVPEKKARKKRVKKIGFREGQKVRVERVKKVELITNPPTTLIDKPKRGQRGRKLNDSYPNPPLRPGETPV